jgi:hypothetical protein
MQMQNSQHSGKNSMPLFQLFLLQLAVHFFGVDISKEQEEELVVLKSRDSKRRIMRMIAKIPFVPLVFLYFAIEYWVEALFGKKSR